MGDLGGSYFYHSDHLGSSSLITDVDGNVVQHIEYVPYGEVFVEERNSTWSTPYKFNGKQLDEETGLYYYGARYYDPRTSVWVSVDPLAEKYPNISGYVYCADNPVKFVDPDGRKITTALFRYINKRNGSGLGWVNLSYKKFIKAMSDFGRTTYGRAFIGSFLDIGQSQYGVKGTGKYSKYNLYIQEIDYVDSQTHYLATATDDNGGTFEGTFTAVENGNGKLDIVLKLNLKGKNKQQIAATIAHELTLHGFEVENIIKIYEKGGIEAVQKFLNENPNGDKDHEALAKKDSKHEGVNAYNQVRDEMIKNDPKIKNEFIEEQKYYEQKCGEK